MDEMLTGATLEGIPIKRLELKDVDGVSLVVTYDPSVREARGFAVDGEEVVRMFRNTRRNTRDLYCADGQVWTVPAYELQRLGMSRDLVESE